MKSGRDQSSSSSRPTPGAADVNLNLDYPLLIPWFQQLKNNLLAFSVPN